MNWDSMQMFGILKARTETPEIFRSYPPFNPPFPGDPGRLSVEQVDANIAYLNQVHGDRLAAITGFLKDQGIFISDLEPEAFFKKLDEVEVLLETILLPTAIAHAPRYLRKASKRDWIDQFDGPGLIYSILADFGILCFHNLKIAFDGRLQWAAMGDRYLDPDIPEKENLSEANRIVAVGLCVKPSGHEAPEDLIGMFCGTVRAATVHNMGPPLFMRPLSEEFCEKLYLLEAKTSEA